MIRPHPYAVLSLILGVTVAPPCLAQGGEPPGDPVYECNVTHAAVQFLVPYTSQHASGWAPSWVASNNPETCVQIIVAHPRQRATSRSYSANPPEGTEFSGRIWAFGRSGRFTNEPATRGWHISGYRMDCLKAVPERGDRMSLLERYAGEEWQQNAAAPYTAQSVFIRFSDGIAKAIRRDVDYGTPCMMGSTGLTCHNPDCPRYQLCELPWVFPNMPCGTCGVPGYDSTAREFGLYQYGTNNLFIGPIDGPTFPGPSAITNAATIESVNTTAGTPVMSAGLFNYYARSDSPYTAPDGQGGYRTYPSYDGGLYFEMIDQLTLRKIRVDGNDRIIANFRVRKWLMWGEGVTGLFHFLGDWFAGVEAAGMVDGCNGCAASDVFAFLSHWMGDE